MIDFREWTEQIPKEPGVYWFFGAILGEMGCDYANDSPKIEPELLLVEVFKISNGVMAKSEGQFFALNKFDKEKRISGHVGYFMKATLPAPPLDASGVFG